ncbi:MAG: hypothetical protein M9894_26430 [Planctomycetes bacterium]|nr:hypothetical protein [Planctomycetota bacterium]
MSGGPRLLPTLVALLAGCAAPGRDAPAAHEEAVPGAAIERSLRRAALDDDLAGRGAVRAWRCCGWPSVEDRRAVARAVELACLSYRVSGDAAWVDAARGWLELLRAGARDDRAAGLTVIALVRLHEVTGEAPLLREALAGGAALGDGAADGLVARVDRGLAALALFEVTGDPGWLALAREVAAGLPAGATDDEDCAAARLLLRLHAVDDDPRWRAAAERRLDRQVFVSAADGLARDELALAPLSIVVTGPPGDPMVDALLAAARRCYLPRGAVLRLPPGERYPDLGRAAAFLAGPDGWTSAPIEDPAALRGAVDAHLRE